ncbi:MAG: site-specific integrase [Polyangia bacterium]
MRKKQSPRVLGPYPNRSAFRLIVIQDGTRKSVVVATEREALALKEELERSLYSPPRHTVGELLSEFESVLRTRRSGERQVEQIVATLTRFFEDLDRDADKLTTEQARALYQRETERVSERTGRRIAADSHQQTLRLAKGMFRWAKEQGLTRNDPFDAVQPIGRKRAGKPQLHIDEARRWAKTATELAEGGDRMALAGLMLLLMGLRASEALLRQVRDVDDDAQVLWIPRGKTASARRRLLVPTSIQGLLRQQCAGRRPEELLFPALTGGRISNASLHKKVHKICDLAGVPRVCPHSLRGLHSTLAVQAGVSAEAVAQSLGHTSFAMTARHYADANVVEASRTQRAMAALQPERPVAPRVPAEAPPAGASALPLDDPELLLRNMSPEARARLKALLLG